MFESPRRYFTFAVYRTCRGHSPLKPPSRKGGVRGTLGSPVFTPLAQRQSTQAHNLGVTGSKLVGGTTNRYGVIGNTWFISRSKMQDQCLLSVYSRGTYVPLRPLCAVSAQWALDAPSILLVRFTEPALKPPLRKGGVRGTLGSLVKLDVKRSRTDVAQRQSA